MMWLRFLILMRLGGEKGVVSVTVCAYVGLENKRVLIFMYFDMTYYSTEIWRRSWMW